MKIFSSFDTTLKEKKLESYYKKYGVHKVHMLKRSILFFLSKVVMPSLQGLIFTGLIATLARYTFYTKNATYISIVIGTLLSMMFYIKAIKGYIDYKMDYCIITPEEIILTQQEGLFRRIVRTLDVKKIKSIYINKQTVLYSIFDAGVIVFMSDGDEQFGEIIFDFIKDPEGQKEIIQNIIGSQQHLVI